ncbi:hypothetical protein PR202_ga02235 [Eleusine coracana subsp. coracana]|uniref:Mitochondrial substrate carrier family protein n=1 Tax=Eleusine coracana subsp. coracana TaxID=191504 RepID=A0AAV5BK82_ELECO|nr:hypothetical protein PR202_ga02235 [Eleusine coracana subsp. coracana]
METREGVLELLLVEVRRSGGTRSSDSHCQQQNAESWQRVHVGEIIAEGIERDFLQMKPAPYNIVLEDGTYKGVLKLGIKFISNVNLDQQSMDCMQCSVPPRQPSIACRSFLNFTLPSLRRKNQLEKPEQSRDGAVVAAACPSIRDARSLSPLEEEKKRRGSLLLLFAPATAVGQRELEGSRSSRGEKPLIRVRRPRRTRALVHSSGIESVDVLSYYTVLNGKPVDLELVLLRDNHIALRAGRPRSMPAELCTSNSNEEAYTAHDCESSLYDTKSDLEIFPEDTELSVHSVQQMEIVKEISIVPGNQISSKACTEVQLKLTCTPPSLVDNDVDSTNTDQYAYGDDMYKHHSVGKCSRELEATVQHRCDGALTVNRHAVAGALAGSVVSTSLHPVDTVKTLIQANSSGQSSFYHTLRHILVERGILGLYGGLASKLACSAPISAIYTFTYEMVKGNLLPILPKEYHSIAHCTAGGCSSIATSFVFTPSECIKQQLQVGSQYWNCWNALVGCLQRGGIASLYAGWGAVLCRNIPHSIIKFYAYESLKQFLLESTPANAKLNSGQTVSLLNLTLSNHLTFLFPLLRK